MAKFQLTIEVDTYWHYIVEATDAREAKRRAVLDFDTIYLDSINPNIEVEDVPDDTPLGDN